MAEVTLHTGVSSTEVGEPPPAEWYTVPGRHRAAGELTRARGGRVDRGRDDRRAGAGERRRLATERAPAGPTWSSDPTAPRALVDGLITGWHEPGASHLLLLEAVAGPELVDDAYTAALAARYRWHEFGDSCLLLPNADVRKATFGT